MTCVTRCAGLFGARFFFDTVLVVSGENVGFFISMVGLLVVWLWD